MLLTFLKTKPAQQGGGGREVHQALAAAGGA
jgi:hypothetical protein